MALGWRQLFEMKALPERVDALEAKPAILKRLRRPRREHD